MLDHIVWQTSSGPSHTAYKVCVIRWMGSFIVRVDIPQRKTDGQKGGKLPGQLSVRRSRGSRGTRPGRARVGKTRQLARAAARESANNTAPVKGTHAVRLQKARVKRGKWIERRFRYAESAIEMDLNFGTFGDIREVILNGHWIDHGRMVGRFWFRIRKISQDFRLKRLPPPPFARRGSRVDVWGWFKRYWEMKHGTWDDVSWLNRRANSSLGPLGRLDEGFHSYPRTVLQEGRERNPYPYTRPTDEVMAAASAARLRRLRSAPGFANRRRKTRRAVERSHDDFSSRD
jgi:hypothetical protein